jgi:hypothetical protein
MAAPDLAESTTPVEVAPSAEISAATEELTQSAVTHEGTGGCLVIGLIYALFYLSGVLLFWMLGSAAHRYTIAYDDLTQAQTLTEVRDALVTTFGAVNITPPDISGRLAPLSSTIDAIKSGADAVHDAKQTLDAAASSVQNAQSK